MLAEGLAVLAATAAAATPAPRVSVSPAEVTIGGTGAVVSGGGAQPGAPLELQSAPYPYKGFQTVVAQTTGATDGSFSFAPVSPDRNTRLRVLEGGQPLGAPILLTVDEAITLRARELGEGRTRLSIRIRHALLGSDAPVTVTWLTAPRSSHAFSQAATTQSRELAAGETFAAVIVNPPARHFSYRVCLDPGWARAMGRPAHGVCAVEAAGEARGIPEPAYPSAGAIAAARGYLEGRAGRTAFAVLDSEGHVSGLDIYEHFETASVVKVMFLIAYLRMVAAEHRSLQPRDTALLYPMIHISDNEAASRVFSIVGQAAVSRIAREVGMTDYAPGVGWWAYTQTSAIDQARLLSMLGTLIPSSLYGYARYLMSSIEPSQSWGFPPVARPAWQVFFKTGQLPEEGLFNEVARLERGRTVFTVAVLTDGDPSMSYGHQTIEGVAARLLAQAP